MRKFLLVAAACAVLYFLVFQVFLVLTDVNDLKTKYPVVIYDKGTEQSHIEVQAKRPPNWTPLTSVSKIAVAAIVLSEDWAFYQHNGFDWDQIYNSAEKDWKTGKFARGGSTISQQVAKNVYLSNHKTLLRKLQEAILTVRIERHWGKARILEVYLNVAEFGEGMFGIGPAARYYFHKSPAELTAKEGAFLAMLLPSPKKYSVSFRKKELTRYAGGIVRSVLGKLLATHRLSEAEYQREFNTPLSFEAHPEVLPVSAPDDEDEAPEGVPAGGVPPPAPPPPEAPPAGAPDAGAPAPAPTPSSVPAGT